MSAKKAAHEYVADLVLWDFASNQSDAAQALIDRFGFEAVDKALCAIETHHARLAGLSSAWPSAESRATDSDSRQAELDTEIV